MSIEYKMHQEETHPEVKKLMKIEFCYDEKTGNIVTGCLYYNERDALKTCNYAKQKIVMNI